MSNLRLLNETTPTSVTSFQVNDVFTDDFNTYKITISDVDSSSSSTWSHMRFVNSSGSLITSSEYSYVNFQYRSYASFGRNAGTNPNEMRYVFFESSADSGAGAVIWVFNPTDTSSHTYMLSESTGFNTASGGGIDGTKMIGNLWNTSNITGFGFRRISGTYDNLTVRTYGLRVD
jgi:hypothetical protein